MASLSSLYFKKETLETLLKTVNAKNEDGVEITVTISDDTNNFGQNVSAFVSQSKEQREAKKKRFYVGNGKCFWTDGVIATAERKEDVQQVSTASASNEIEMPF